MPRRVQGASGSAALPADRRKIAHPVQAHLNGLGAQELTFQLQIASITAKRAACPNHPVTWRRRVATFAHHRANRPPRQWGSGKGCNIAVGRHASPRNPSYSGQDAVLERAG
jgi:hypothetical protein